MKQMSDHIVFRSGMSFDGKGKSFSGAVPIPKFHDRGDGILVADLKSAGIAFEPIHCGGFHRPKQGRSELYAASHPYTLSCYPKDGYLKITDCGEYYDATEHGMNHVGRLDQGFFYDDPRPATWENTRLPMLHGYWGFDWACTYEKAEVFDPQKGFIRTASPYGLYFFRVGQRFRFINVPDEVACGEYALDTESGLLYCRPAEGDETAAFTLSVKEHCFVLRNLEDVIIENCNIEKFTGDAIVIDNCRRVTLRNCRISNIGCRAIVIKDSFDVHIENCEVFHTGDSSIDMQCGNRTTLTMANCGVTGCQIHGIAYWSKVYSPGISLTGCGMYVKNCRIFDGPHTAISYSGNEMTIQGNIIYDVLSQTDDAGAIYSGRNPTFRGNLIADNLFFRTGGYGSFTSGIYNDDMLSGTRIERNVFWRINNAVLCGGGNDFCIRNNLFYDCNPAIRIDNRGTNLSEQWRGCMRQFRDAYEEIFSDPKTGELYLSRYPEIGKWKAYFEHAELPVAYADGLLEGNLCYGNWIEYSDWCDTRNDFVLRDNRICGAGELMGKIPERFRCILAECGEL